MKLRLQGNSVRLRVSQREAAQLAETGKISETVDFAPRPFVYALETSPLAKTVTADFENDRLRVVIPEAAAEKWLGSDLAGLAAELPAVGGKRLKLLIEKDFACLHKRPGEDDEDAFLSPAEGKNVDRRKVSVVWL